MKKEIIVGSRESALAMWQARAVVEELARICPQYSYRIVGIKTRGDKITDVPLAKIGGKGLFTKELETAMLRGEIHMAVHSMKDLPTELPQGLTVGAVLKRDYPGDVLISRHNVKLAELPAGSRIGTSSLRRRAQLLHYRPDLTVVELRGNIHTRLRKLREESLEAVVLAYAGIRRMNWEGIITESIPLEICLPAAGQGAIAVEVPCEDKETLELVKKLDHLKTRLEIEAERAFLKGLEGGCQVPIGVLGRIDGPKLTLEGVVADLEGKKLLRQGTDGSPHRAPAVGAALAKAMLEKGAGEILRCLREKDACD